MMIENPETLFAKTKFFTLIETEEAKPARVVVVTEYASNLLPDTERALLFKILASVKVAQQDVVLDNFSAHNLSLALLKKKFHPQIVLAFTSRANALGENLQTPVYEILKFGEIKALRAAPLSKILSSNEHKSVLWKNLKVMFEI